MLTRDLEKRVISKLNSNKAIIIFGARQTGKTTLLETVTKTLDQILWFNADDKKDYNSLIQLLNNPEKHIGKIKYLVIDEAQQVENIGAELKTLHDKYKNQLQIIATGSSSFDLANKINEPMTGRKWEYQMYPVSFQEMCNYHSCITEKSLLEKRMLYGYYPDVVMNPESAEEIIRSLANGNMYKDVLKWANISRSNKIYELTKALAYQVGSQVSYREIGQLIDLDHKTVEKYINLLEQAFIIFRVGSYSRNLRNEIKSSSKYFFYDVGIRNAVLEDFRPLNKRDDIGGLFENFIIAELVKKYEKIGYFWRTRDQNEIDYLIEQGGEIDAFEIKWNPKSRVNFPRNFISAYIPKSSHVINRENFDSLLLNSYSTSR